jgi:hypothetical protein
MDLRGLGAFLSAIAGYFSAQAGAQAGQLQGLLMGEELTERRKRMRMTEEAHQEQMETMRLQRRLQEAEEQRRAEMHSLQKDILSTQAEKSKIDLTNTRLWSLFQQGVSPSQITDPVLRAQYEPFFNYQMVLGSLDAVMTNEELEELVGKLPEEQRGAIRIVGRVKLYQNQMRQQMMERYLKGTDINIATGEYQLRTAKINNAINIILNNINAEGANWDKRPPQQKIQAVQKWLKQLGLEDVPPEIANMFQNVQSADARQLALLQAQINWNMQANLRLYDKQFANTLALNREAWWNNIVAGALTGQIPQGGGGFAGGSGGGGYVAPVGFGAPPPPNFFETTRDSRGSQLNLSLLNKYVQVPYNVPVPARVGGQMAIRNLAELQGEVLEIYKRLDSPNASITADEISTLITFDAGLHYAQMVQGGIGDWNIALDMAVGRVLPVLRSINLYRSNPNYKKVVEDWARAYYANRQRATAPQRGQGGQQRQGQPPQQGRQGGQGQPPAPQGRRSQPFVERGTAHRGGI